MALLQWGMGCYKECVYLTLKLNSDFFSKFFKITRTCREGKELRLGGEEGLLVKGDRSYFRYHSEDIWFHTSQVQFV